MLNIHRPFNTMVYQITGKITSTVLEIAGYRGVVVMVLEGLFLFPLAMLLPASKLKLV